MTLKRVAWLFLFTLTVSITQVFANDKDAIADAVFGAKLNEKFTLHEPTYFVFGDDDLKLQFSMRYRLSKKYNFYFALTQLMFWSIYDKSKPFRELNYKPEVFYRFINKEDSALRSIDVGYYHHSNGKDGLSSRSLDKVFLRTSFITNHHDQLLGAIVKLQKIFNEDSTNEDISNYLGFWELTAFYSGLISIDGNNLGIRFRTFAGSKVYDIDKGGYEVGLVYNLDSSDLNPMLYLQRYEGYSETLLDYNRRSTEYRLGFMLAY